MSRMLDKVSKLLNKAENAGTPEEGEAFMAKAMELASINAIDLAVARAHQANKEKAEVPEERRIQCNPHTRKQNRKHFVDLMLAICDTNDIECLIYGGDHPTGVIGIGFPSDLDFAESLYVHLAVEMATECDQALKEGKNKEVRRIKRTTKVDIPWEDRDWGGWSSKRNTYYDENPEDDVYCYRRSEDTDATYLERLAEANEQARKTYLEDIELGREVRSPGLDRWGNPKWRKPVPPPAYRDVPVLDDDGNEIWDEKEVSVVDGRVFRNEFYGAFVMRMRGRLREIRASVERERGTLEESSSVALALVDKREAVKQAYDDRVKVMHLGSGYGGAMSDDRKDDRTGRGRTEGTRAAEVVPVTEGRGVKS